MDGGGRIRAVHAARAARVRRSARRRVLDEHGSRVTTAAYTEYREFPIYTLEILPLILARVDRSELLRQASTGGTRIE